MLDIKEEMQRSRDMAEYAMMFHNPKAVNRIRRDRSNEEALKDEETSDIFFKQIEQMFGRKMDNDSLDKGKQDKTTEERKATQKSSRLMKNPNERFGGIKHDLDTIQVSKTKPSKD